MTILTATNLTNIRRNAILTRANFECLESPYHYCVCCGDFIPGANTYEDEERVHSFPLCKDKRHHWKTFQHLVRQTYFDQLGNLDIDNDNEYDTPWSTDMVDACELAVCREWPICLCNLNVFARLFLRDPSYFVLFISDRSKVPIYYQYEHSVVEDNELELDLDSDTELDTDDEEELDEEELDEEDNSNDDDSSDSSDTETVVMSYQDRCPNEYDKQCNSMFTICTRNNKTWHAIGSNSDSLYSESLHRSMTSFERWW